MQKIQKTNTVPKSLDSKITNQRRSEIIAEKKFPNGSTISDFPKKSLITYTDKYKQKDIKKALKEIYKDKCVFCEQRVESFHIEHYRPKSKYYWLAYSWDNLLYCCPRCNENKLNKFPIENSVAKFNSKDIKKIHNLRDKYDDFEKPLFVNPEKEDVFLDISFNKKGEFNTKKITNRRLLETIKQLKLNREDLVNYRKPIYDEFEKQITEKKYEMLNGNLKAKIELEYIIKEFINKTKNVKTEFILYRKFIIKKWVYDLIN